MGLNASGVNAVAIQLATGTLAQGFFTPGGGRGNPHQVLDILEIVRLYPAMFLRPGNKSPEAMNVSGRRRYTIDEGGSHKTNLVQVIAESRNDIDILELHRFRQLPVSASTNP